MGVQSPSTHATVPKPVFHMGITRGYPKPLAFFSIQNDNAEELARVYYERRKHR